MQRKQTLWLLLSALVILLTFFMPYGIHSGSALNTEVISETNISAKTNFILAILSGLIAGFALIIIFLHGNRGLQKKMTLLLVLICIATAAYMFYDANLTDKGNKLVIGLLGSNLYVGILAPFISTALAIMAYLGIKKDEKLIRDMDRLR